MANGNKANDKSFSFTSDVFGGQFLLRIKDTRQWLFILYVFALILIYITMRLGIDDTMLKQRQNQRMLKNLKADYTSKVARLQNQSKQGEIELRLTSTGSKLQKPKQPARLVELPK